MEGRDMLKQGIIRRIGDGHTTSILDQNWLPRPSNMHPIISRVVDPPHMVSELIQVDGDWDRTRVDEVFLPTDAKAILSIPVCTRQIDDFWHAS